MAKLRGFHTRGRVEAGVDEVGRGCLAGPVVAAAVILPKGYRHPLLNDSKQLNSKSKDILYEHIRSRAVAYHIASIDHSIIDKVNILQATFLAMHKAIGNLETQPNHLLIDGNRFPAHERIAHTCVIKGDAKFKSIAAASVLAKVYRDRYMTEQALKYPGYGWERNMAYPTKEHRKAIAELGVTPLHRLSFKLLADTE